MEASTPIPGNGETAPAEAPPADATVSASTEQDQPQTLESQLAEVLAGQKQQHAEMAQLRRELDQARAAAPTGPAPAVLDPEQLRQARLAELSAHDFYCPGCGRTYNYQRECTGSAEAPHPAIEVVSTDEVKNAPDPNNDPQGFREWQTHHTAAPVSV